MAIVVRSTFASPGYVLIDPPYKSITKILFLEVSRYWVFVVLPVFFVSMATGS